MQSEKVIQVLRDHQQKVKQDKIKEIQERKIKKEQEPKETAGTQGNHAGSNLSWLLTTVFEPLERSKRFQLLSS